MRHHPRPTPEETSAAEDAGTTAAPPPDAGATTEAPSPALSRPEAPRGPSATSSRPWRLRAGES
ncbi:hypothetical protein QEG98_10225 [Myxococcus sp. MxC21-1]|uniref:hypothetical protein n=1 Tax=Myxococcus sp. MxC21-1 TaxID=3041439 RepID=UPI00293105A5|nr:hypothetical protein [Myxococcus sp. MxC21-1]WNZ64028.1 hypothetical protein QEG98_10225 [Myxococcus sp. MxC21-1]